MNLFFRPVFRSYNPLDDSLRDRGKAIEKPQPVDLEEHIEDQLEAAKDTSVMEEMVRDRFATVES